MRVHIPLGMASLPELAALVRSKIVEWSVVSSSTSWMQFISWCFVSHPRLRLTLSSFAVEQYFISRAEMLIHNSNPQLALALSFFLPLVALICFDFLLWVCRLIRPPTTTTKPSRRRRRESLKHPVTTS